jgi:hypothetical protein
MKSLRMRMIPMIPLTEGWGKGGRLVVCTVCTYYPGAPQWR